jgi:beta-N-acetylhexosaminidase
MRVQQARRRRLVALAVAVLAGLVLAAGPWGGSGMAPRLPTRVTKRYTSSRHRAEAPLPGPASMPLRRALGQKIVTAYDGTAPPASLLRAARRGHIGGVILFARNVASVAAVRRSVDRLQHAARRGGNPPLLVMVDQEGGSVKRFASLPPRISPQQMGAGRAPAASALSQGIRTGRALRAAGVDVDLAPVADVPPGSLNILGDRAYGHDPRTVARAACSFADGLGRGGVAATFKHFPGLGRARTNTDLQPTAVTATKPELESDILPYRSCAASVPLVMVSSASYPAVTGTLPAVLAPATYRRMLPSTGFRGLTISDDLEAPSIASLASPGRRAINAGLDLLLYGRGENTAEAAYARLRADLVAHRLSARKVRRSAADIVALKDRYAR